MPSSLAPTVTALASEPQTAIPVAEEPPTATGSVYTNSLEALSQGSFSGSEILKELKELSNESASDANAATISPSPLVNGPCPASDNVDKDAGHATPNSSPENFSQNNNTTTNNSVSRSKEQGVPQRHNGGNHSRNFPRGAAAGTRPRGGHQNRHNQNHLNNRWNPPWNFNGRDGYRQVERFMPMNIYGPLVNSPIFVGYPDMSLSHHNIPPQPLEWITGMQPYMAPPFPPVEYQQQHNTQLHSMLLKQIEYYFSTENLCKDYFLRKNMDEQGWVPISLIAGFRRVKQLTNDQQNILVALRGSAIVEVKSNKVRKRIDWNRWILPPSSFPSPIQSSETPPI